MRPAIEEAGIRFRNNDVGGGIDVWLGAEAKITGVKAGLQRDLD